MSISATADSSPVTSGPMCRPSSRRCWSARARRSMSADSMSAGWELIDFDRGTGLRKWMGFDADSDSVLVSYEQDRAAQAAILDANKAAQAEGFDRRSDFWHAA